MVEANPYDDLIPGEREHVQKKKAGKRRMLSDACTSEWCGACVCVCGLTPIATVFSFFGEPSVFRSCGKRSEKETRRARAEDREDGETTG